MKGLWSGFGDFAMPSQKNSQTYFHVTFGFISSSLSVV